MFTDYANFEITIGPRSGAGFPFTVHSDEGGDARGVLRLPTDDATYQQLAERLETFKTDEAALRQIGEILFRALIDQDRVRTVYSRTQSLVDDRRDLGLRITLNIGETADDGAVGALPWEFLYDPDKGHLSLLDAPMLRYIQQPFRPAPLAAVLPLRVLLTGAQTGEPLQVERELNEVHAALAGLSSNLVVEVEPHLTVANFRQLLRKNFHIWHFVGHGGVGADGSGMLLFESARTAGEPQEVSAGQLNTVLYRSGVQIIVLNACNSARLATAPLLSLAPALIRAQVPAVIAMQFAVSDRSARVFATDFYRTLAEGDPIDACVTEGRRAVSFEVPAGRPDWGTPVVYSRAANGKLFELPAATPVPAPVSPTQQTGGGSNVNLQGNTINSSNLTINTGTMSTTQSGGTTGAGSAAASEDDDAEVLGLQQQIKAWQDRLQVLRLQEARGAGTAANSLDMRDLDAQILDARQQIIGVRAEQISRLNKRNPQPDEPLRRRIAALNAELIEETLSVKRAEIKALNERLRVQTSAAGRERIGAEVDAKNREIRALEQQRDALA